MALILGDQVAKDPAAAAGPVTESSSSSQDTLESTDKKNKVGDSRLIEQRLIVQNNHSLELSFFTPLLSTTSATIDDGDHVGSANRQVLSPAGTLHPMVMGLGEHAGCRRATMTFSQDSRC